MSFEIRDEFDKELLDVDAAELHAVLAGPTAFDLRRNSKQPFFVSTLLHGNETSGWNAVRRLMREQHDTSLILFIGNVAAAAQNLRHLPNERDLNRVWRLPKWHSFLNDLLQATKPWCGIDIHNNSGPNPHYSVVTDNHPTTHGLAKLFSNKLIYTEHTKDILSYAVSQHCPALTIETGTVDDPQSEVRAFDFLKRLCRMDHPPELACSNLETFETLGIVKVESEHGTQRDFPHFDAALDHKSFQTIATGTTFVPSLAEGWQVKVMNPADDLEITDEFFVKHDREIRLKQDVVLSMFTRKPLLAMQDCVCYFLGRTSSTHG